MTRAADSDTDSGTGSDAEARTGPDPVLRRIAECQLVVVIRSPTAADALAVGRILLVAGVEGLEVTGTTPGACDVLAALRRDAESRVLLGVGSIRTVEDARRADDADADFLVSPGSPASLTEAMLATGRLVLPGVFTATEVMRARDIGARAVKLFPANVIGPDGLRAMRGPFPDVAFVPTGGISPDELGTWLDAGALAVGIGGRLAPPTLHGGTDASALTARVRDALAEVARRKSS